MKCPKCCSENDVKSGFMKGKHRYKCKNCNCNYTQSNKRGASLQIKRQALNLYLEGVRFISIGRIIGAHNVTVLNWIRNMGESIKSYVQTEMPLDIRHVDLAKIMDIDHY